jgi:ABC-type branched-subunit amino acid transport system substrate-binding protein
VLGLRALGALLLLTAGVAGCDSQTSAEPGEATLTVYVSAPLSGPARAEGRALAEGAAAALEDAGGEAGGFAVAAEYLDLAGRNETRFDAVTAGANARTASEDSTTIAYVGELDSGASRTSVPITNSAGILQVAPGSGASDLVRDETYNDDVPSAVQGTGERTFAQLVPTYEPGERPRTSRPADLGYEAMASILAAIERASNPADRAAVVEAYFDGTERDSRLGRYRIAETGEFEPLRG